MEDRLRVRTFRQRLLRWYRHYHRDLPWRKTADPYAILVSEIMLQQTQVDRVIPKYQEWLARYPTAAVLAKAPLKQVKKAWYPLGYNIRPVRLRRIAKQMVRDHGGRLPSTYDGLIAMDGVGRYTAGAVLSFAYRQRAPIVDTNVARVLGRVFGVDGNLKGSRASKALWALAERLLPKKDAYDFNQALMDFGATMCTAKKPKCLICVMRDMCSSYPVSG